MKDWKHGFLFVFYLLPVSFLAGCGSHSSTSSGPSAFSNPALAKAPHSIAVSSVAFAPGGAIPEQYTCDGQNASPPLQWQGVPKGSKTLALLCEDPDAPNGTFTHWMVWNLPSSTTSLPENVQPVASLSGGAKQGANGFGKTGYGGACPPSGTHRYIWTIYALDTALNLPGNATKDQLVAAMGDHVLAQGQLMGKYTKK